MTKKDSLSITEFMKQLEIESKKVKNINKTLQEVLFSESTDEVTASSEQLMELLIHMPQAIQQYLKEIDSCRLITEYLKRTPSTATKKRLL